MPRLVPGSRLRSASKLVEHVLDTAPCATGTLRARRRWCTCSGCPCSSSTSILLPHGRPLVLTAHDVLPRQPRAGQLAAQRRLYGRMDAVVVHTHRGRERLLAEVGVDPPRRDAIPHGVLRPGASRAWRQRLQPAKPDSSPLLRASPPVKLPASCPATTVDRWCCSLGCCARTRGSTICSAPGARSSASSARTPSPPPSRACRGWHRDGAVGGAGALRGVRLVSRFVSDGELRQALVCAGPTWWCSPDREIQQSGVAFTALGQARHCCSSYVGGFPELCPDGRRAHVRRGRGKGRWGARCSSCSRTPLGPRAMAASAAGGVGSPLVESIAERTLALYREAGSPRNPQHGQAPAAEIIFWVCEADLLDAGGLRGWSWRRSPASSAEASPAPVQVSDEAAELPSLTLIIAAHDEERVIGPRVRNALALDYPRELLQVIVVCDGCADATSAERCSAGDGSSSNTP